jgi:purine-nucleoside phosphorylase
MNLTLDHIKETAAFLTSKGVRAPEVGIVLGTGLGGLVDKIDIELEINYSDIPHFPEATVEFHKSRLIYGKLGGKQVLAMQGRYHFYEGYTMQQVTFPIRVMKVLGIETVLLSNAAGAMNLDYKKGTLMLITDHINHQPENPLNGPNLDELGARFPDMSQAYNHALNAKFLEMAAAQNITLETGIYISVPGPMLESPAEYRMLRTLGADAVGMSTVPEVIVANQMNMKCAAISVLTDECDPDNLVPVDIADIIAVAGEAEPGLTTLFEKVVAEL